MFDNTQTPVTPLMPLQPRTSDGSRWILFDPELAADCLSAYRALRLMLLAACALIAAPLRAEKIATADSGPDTVLELSAKANPAVKQARQPHAQPLAAPSNKLGLWFQISGKQSMTCLEIVHAHAPPQRQVFYKLSWYSPLHNLPPPCGSQIPSVSTLAPLCLPGPYPLVDRRNIDRPQSAFASAVIHSQGENYVR